MPLDALDFARAAPRIGCLTPFLKAMATAEEARVAIVPHRMMEPPVHRPAAHAEEPWIEHFHMPEPMFEKPPEIADGRVAIPTHPVLTLSAQTRDRTVTTADITTGDAR